MRFLIALITAFALILPAAAAERFDDPLKLVEHIYAHYSDGTIETLDANAYWSPRLAELIASDEARGELGSLTFDPFINSQEDFMSDLQISLAEADDKQALVAVGFDNGGGYQQSMFTLVPGPDGWKIDEIEGVTPGREWTLSEILANPL